MKDWNGRERHDTMTGGVHTNYKKGMVILYIKRTYFIIKDILLELKKRKGIKMLQTIGIIIFFIAIIVSIGSYAWDIFKVIIEMPTINALNTVCGLMVLAMACVSGCAEKQEAKDAYGKIGIGFLVLTIILSIYCLFH